MHGLIFETSVWLLAESTRLLSSPLSTEENMARDTNFNRKYGAPTPSELPYWNLKTRSFSSFITVVKSWSRINVLRASIHKNIMYSAQAACCPSPLWTNPQPTHTRYTAKKSLSSFYLASGDRSCLDILFKPRQRFKQRHQTNCFTVYFFAKRNSKPTNPYNHK